MNDRDLLVAYSTGYADADLSILGDVHQHDFALRAMEVRHLAGLREVGRQAWVWGVQS
ncbi:hypothetical protein SEA_LOZINAK_83 [Gordonia phage Lozinak]|uniref:Uncharacterized protein n=5 Tax=Smoothievirus TaxID=1982557 RepID=A0A2D1GFS9_9CAUD|nr:hypothetical protein BEN60_gp123 [Gordonia phage Smoothie]YP_009273117.1 hypothetical protein BH768_gp125 [Gordonia phage ClubL]YP_009276195.1 hypothetical protein BH772_gp127 [Gordonia phage Bachita]YP_009281238.1 hypothetical protein BIZ74_gp121 [Gordonia phage Cucurbita]ATN90709.1 hypothetical protein SEA_LOZINAK_83 [Gordonia phage Lozinak]AUE23590.1 hypothetical protein SEA_TONIANN_83 [Gordonia phage Toniann]QAU06947.1 hypothetical protein SEA_APHELION_82 [Gordonia phage Aphelion]QKY7